MSLDNESRQAMIVYRLEKADVALEDAAFLTDAGRIILLRTGFIMLCIMQLQPCC